jgi:hypothetical protein
MGSLVPVTDEEFLRLGDMPGSHEPDHKLHQCDFPQSFLEVMKAGSEQPQDFGWSGSRKKKLPLDAYAANFLLHLLRLQYLKKMGAKTGPEVSSEDNRRRISDKIQAEKIAFL